VTALGFSLINNHPFVDGNKRIAHAAIEVTLL
jgi:death-on-curing protein